MQQTGHAHIVGVAPAPGHMAARTFARQALADPIVGLGWCIGARVVGHGAMVRGDKVGWDAMARVSQRKRQGAVRGIGVDQVHTLERHF